MNHTTCCILAASLTAVWAAEVPKRGRAAVTAQDTSSAEKTVPTMSSPVLGYMANESGTMISRVMGVPGASTVGDSVPLPEGVGRVWLDPTQTWVLTQRKDLTGLAIVSLGGAAAGTVVEIGSSMAMSDLAAFSPKGRNAAVYSRELARLQVLSSGGVIGDFTAGSLPGEPILRLAIDDSGAVPIAVTAEGAYLIAAAAAPRLLYPGTLSDAGFAYGQPALLLADAGLNQVVVVDNPAGMAVARVVATNIGAGKMWIRPTSDGRWVFAVCAGSQTAHRIDMTTAAVDAVNLPARPSRLDAVGRGGALAFSAAGRGPVWMLSADSGVMRVSFAARAARNEEVGQ